MISLSDVLRGVVNSPISGQADNQQESSHNQLVNFCDVRKLKTASIDIINFVHFHLLT